MTGIMALILVLNLFFGGVFFDNHIANRSKPIDNDHIYDVGMGNAINQSNSGWISAMPRPGDDPPPPAPPGP
jgi:hypothetical protein